MQIDSKCILCKYFIQVVLKHDVIGKYKVIDCEKNISIKEVIKVIECSYYLEKEKE